MTSQVHSSHSEAGGSAFFVRTFRRTLGLIFGLLAAAVVVLTFLAVFLVSSVAALLWTALGIGGGALILLAVLNSTLSGIYKAAVYRYASQGQVATQFDRTLIQNAFHAKGATA